MSPSCRSYWKNNAAGIELSTEVASWLADTAKVLQQASELTKGDVSSAERRQILGQLADAAADYRTKVYADGFAAKKEVSRDAISAMLSDALSVMDATIANNLREDGLYNAYNILSHNESSAAVDLLYPMLEGQVSALSAGVLSPQQAVTLLDKLFASEMFREDQQTFMLYPDRALPGFSKKNCIDADRVAGNALLQQMIAKDDRRIIEADVEGNFHFNAVFDNAAVLTDALNKVAADYGDIGPGALADVLVCYEEIFNHQAFTGRSGTMFGYEGLGCIYWHMVSKLLLAVQENYFAAYQLDPAAESTQKLAEYYYKVRFGIGFNKTPDVYGAFPTDPYSHTPKQAGAQQPGMTGQVKEEILTRFGELGVLVEDGAIRIAPSLLRKREFLNEAGNFRFIDIDAQWQELALSENSLAFTYCQIPVVYHLTDSAEGKVTLTSNKDEPQICDGLSIDAIVCKNIFARNGVVTRIDVELPESMLLGE